VADLTNQTPATGSSLAFGTDGGVEYAMGDAGPIYPGVRFVRTVLLAGNEPAEVIAATGVGANTADRVPVAIFRRTAQRTTFVWCLALDGAPPQIEVPASESGSVVRLRIADPAGAWEATVDTDTRRVSVARRR
jgi:hypothetical protein